MAGTVEDVTVNGFEADFDPWVASTDLDPSDDEGTLKVAVNNPAGVSCHCTWSCAIVDPHQI